ncbi:hypothetical protein [Lacinutrix undariae]
MQFKYYLQSKLPFYVALSFAFVLASCGSYQYAGYNNDGIYSSESVTYEDEPYVEAEAAVSNNDYYKNYFGEKSQQYGDIPEEDVIFTDIDSYSADYDDTYYEDDYNSGYAGWGDNSDNVTVNIYSNNGYNNFGYNSWNTPYYTYGWYRPYRNNFWNWNMGWNNYYGYNSWNSPFYGYGYNNYYPHYNGYAYSNGYRGRNRSYNASRRGSLVGNNSNGRINSQRSGYNNATRRNSSSTLRRSNSRSTIRPRTTTIRRSNSTIRNTNTTPRTNRTTTRRSSTRSSNARSTNTSTRRSSSNINSSSSSSRSSGTSSSRGSSSSRSSGRRGN